MMQTEINEQIVDRQLIDAGIGKDNEEQSVRSMFFHLFCAIRYYRDMTYAEKNTAGFLYRNKFKDVYETETRKVSPHTPLIKKRAES